MVAGSLLQTYYFNFYCICRTVVLFFLCGISNLYGMANGTSISLASVCAFFCFVFLTRAILKGLAPLRIVYVLFDNVFLYGLILWI